MLAESFARRLLGNIYTSKRFCFVNFAADFITAVDSNKASFSSNLPLLLRLCPLRIEKSFHSKSHKLLISKINKQ